MEKLLTISDMNCGHCEAKIDKGLNETAGVSAKVDLANKQVSVTSDLSDQDLINLVKEIGYTVSQVK